MDDFVTIGLFFNILNSKHSFVEFFGGFYNIIELLKLDEQKLNYRHLKLKLTGTYCT